MLESASHLERGRPRGGKNGKGGRPAQKKPRRKPNAPKVTKEKKNKCYQWWRHPECPKPKKKEAVSNTALGIDAGDVDLAFMSECESKKLQ